MKSGIYFFLILTFAFPLSLLASDGNTGSRKMHTLDSLKQYDYAFAELSPLHREDREKFRQQNREFFLEEITYPFSTPFTPQWAGKFDNKYILDKEDLYNHFRNEKSYELVMIKGPNLMHNFSFEVIVYRKIKGKYLVVRSHIEEERFVEKSYRVIEQAEFDALRTSLNKLADMTEKQGGDFFLTDPGLVDECVAGKGQAEEVSEMSCKLELTSGVVIDNTSDEQFLLYGYDGVYDAVHPRRQMYDRVREDEIEKPFFQEVKWNKTYAEGTSVAEVY
ncbi:MAG: hypothetical protein WBB45_03935 [Cyclobacteriaceae bacterium]